VEINKELAIRGITPAQKTKATRWGGLREGLQADACGKFSGRSEAGFFRQKTW
jgi:hypothetical protein